MKSNLIWIALIAGIVALSSCKKTNTDPDNPTVQTSPMLGKWYVQSISEKTWEDGVLTEDSTETYGNGAYLDFYDSTHIAAFVDGGYDTIETAIISTTQFILDGDTANAVRLTANVFDWTFEYLEQWGGVNYRYLTQIDMTR